MPAFKVTTTCIILATNEKDAKMGFCAYVGGDLGIECLKAKLELTNKQMTQLVKEGYSISECYDYNEDMRKFADSLEELEK